MDIFKNSPCPDSVALKMLNDAGVVLPCKTGKIAAYALEKVLNDLERAVSIRRALICKFYMPQLLLLTCNTDCLSASSCI